MRVAFNFVHANEIENFAALSNRTKVGQTTNGFHIRTATIYIFETNKNHEFHCLLFR